MFAALALFASACEENVNKGTVWDDPHFIRITSSKESLLERGEKVGFSWALEDTISLYDVEYREVPIRNNDEKSKIFFSYEWTASTPLYAVFPRNEETTMNGGTLTLNVPSSQPVSKLSDYGPMTFVGKVTGNNTAYKLNPLKNVVSQLKLSMSAATATSIKIEAIGGEYLAGNMSVDCAKLTADEEDADFWTIVDDDKKSSSITIVPVEGSSAITEDGCFKIGAYYLSILPQVYSQGLRITVERKDMAPLVRILGDGEGCTAVRNEVLEFPGDLDDTLPDEFTIKLDFQHVAEDGTKTGIWPFVEEKVANDATYTYAYKYLVDGIEMTANFEFFISGNKGAYNITVNGLRMAAKNSRFTLPGVGDRYLKSVTLDVTNSYAKGFALVEMNWNVLYTGANATAGNPSSVTFPDGGVSTEKDTPYYLRFTAANSDIKTVTLVYSKTL